MTNYINKCCKNRGNKMTVEELEKRIKNNHLDSVYLLYGEENFLLESTVKKIRNLFGEVTKGINYIEIDETNINKLIQELQTPAFGYEKKLIIVKNTGIFKREIKKKGADFANYRDKLIEYLKENVEEVSDTIILVFIEETVDKTKLLSTLEEQNAVICNFEYQKIPNILARLKAICKAYEVSISDTNLKYFVECVGINLQDLINEIRKQIEYVGTNGEITKETIDILAIKKLESVIFDLTDSLGRKDTKTAIIVLNNLLYEKEPIQKILITLYNHFKKLYLTKLAIKQGRDIRRKFRIKIKFKFFNRKVQNTSKLF